MENQKIIERIDPAIIAGLYKNFRDSIQAILELTDNAVDDIKEGHKMVLSVELDKDKKLRIVNEGGDGMGMDQLQNFFIWGLSKKRKKLGRYGQGGKAAMGYLGKTWKIISKKESEKKRYEVIENDWDDRAGGLKEYTPTIRDDDTIADNVVQIEIGDLKKTVNKLELKRTLAKTYKPLIDRGILEIISSGSVQTEAYTFELPQGYFGFKLSTGQRICGWLGTLAKGSSVRGGVRCYVFGRLVDEREYFQQKDSNYKESLDRIIGELYIDTEDLPLTLNKTDIDKSSNIWSEIQSVMFSKLQPYVDLLLEEKDKYTPSEKDLKVTIEAGELWKEFVQNYNKELSSMGKGSINLLLSQGQKKPIKVAGKENPEPEIPKKDTQKNKEIGRINNPATPPPEEAIGRRKRTFAVLTPELKELPEAERYTVSTDFAGIRRLFVNTQFPLFKIRKKQLRLYLWETLALEYAKDDDFSDQYAQNYLDELNTLIHSLGKFVQTKHIRLED